jgi:signal peptidase I
MGGSHARRDEAAPGGRAERRRVAQRAKRRRRRSAAREVPLIILVALLIALAIKMFLVQAFVIPSGSMEQTIKVGDRVVVDKLTPWFGSKPQRGDVIVFKDPDHWLRAEGAVGKSDGPVVIKQVKGALTFIGLLPSDRDQDLIKRVVGVGGDRVVCCDKGGRVTVNGTPITESYLYPGNAPSRMRFDVTVPSGRLFVMGDHRADSADSRYHMDGPFQGTIPEDRVVGRALAIAWPFGHWRTLEERDTYASVPDPGSGGRSVSMNDMHVKDRHVKNEQGMIPLPTPAELPLVMGVVGLRRIRGGRRHEVRSGCGGRGSRRTVRT